MTRRVPLASASAIRMRGRAAATVIALLVALTGLIATALPLPGVAQSAATHHLQRARLAEDAGDTEAAIVQRLWADESLVRIDQRDHNRWQVWRLLQRLNTNALHQPPAGPWTVDGWWALARTHRRDARTPWVLAAALDDWEARHPDHPARESVLPSLRVDLPATRSHTMVDTTTAPSRPRRLALVLPTSGGLGAAGNAIIDGVLEAAREDASVSYRMFDSGGGMALGAYDAAVRTRPDLIIGPLDRGAVETLIRRGSMPVPTLALNYGPRSAWGAGGLWQFGLSPEDDAAAAAQQALANGQLRAAVLAADNDWGRRVAGAFIDRYETGGGFIVREGLFWPNSDEVHNGVRALLQPDSAYPLWRDARPSRKDTPRQEGHREVDALFVAAKPRDARLIVPLLRFHHAVDLPVYAPDAARGSSGNPEVDRDLAGVMVCGAKAESAASVANASLHAMGRDAYRISQSLDVLGGGRVINGATGELHMGTGRQIRRTPECLRISG